MKTENVETTVSPDGALIESLSAAGRLFQNRCWVMGTSGNFSAVLRRDPVALLVTASGVDKGHLSANDYLVVDETGRPHGTGRPSAETALHLAIVQELGAQSVLHTHSVWSSFLTDIFPEANGLEIEGYEMLKGLSGVTTHQHREWVPILENSQDYKALAGDLRTAIRANPGIHAVLLRRHGLYTWGSDIAEACRHVEIFEFLFEVLGRKHSFTTGSRS